MRQKDGTCSVMTRELAVCDNKRAVERRHIFTKTWGLRKGATIGHIRVARVVPEEFRKTYNILRPVAHTCILIGHDTDTVIRDNGTCFSVHSKFLGSKFDNRMERGAFGDGHDSKGQFRVCSKSKQDIKIHK